MCVCVCAFRVHWVHAGPRKRPSGPGGGDPPLPLRPSQPPPAKKYRGSAPPSLETPTHPFRPRSLLMLATLLLGFSAARRTVPANAGAATLQGPPPPSPSPPLYLLCLPNFEDQFPDERWWTFFGADEASPFRSRVFVPLLRRGRRVMGVKRGGGEGCGPPQLSTLL